MPDSDLNLSVLALSQEGQCPAGVHLDCKVVKFYQCHQRWQGLHTCILDAKGQGSVFDGE